jgi:hypothetical protein
LELHQTAGVGMYLLVTEYEPTKFKKNESKAIDSDIMDNWKQICSFRSHNWWLYQCRQWHHHSGGYSGYFLKEFLEDRGGNKEANNDGDDEKEKEEIGNEREQKSYSLLDAINLMHTLLTFLTDLERYPW